MNIDAKRLAKDRAYWDEVAPEGATHYDPEDIDAPWMMETAKNWMFYWGGKKEWVGYSQRAMLTRILARLVIRPDAPEEWDGTGLPPVGTECECQIWDESWHAVEITAHARFGICIVKPGSSGEGYTGKDSKFRPIRTPDQRERDDVVAAAEDLMNSRPPEHTDTASKAFALLYDAGMLRRAGE